MAFLSDIIKLLRKLPRTFNEFKNKLKQRKLENQQRKQQLLLLENAKLNNNETEIKNNLQELNTENISNENDTYFEEVQIIPPDDELI